MSYYKSSVEMFMAKAKRFKLAADCHWAIAKNGGGGCHYNKARFYYNQAIINKAKANRAREAIVAYSEHSKADI